MDPLLQRHSHITVPSVQYGALHLVNAQTPAAWILGCVNEAIETMSSAAWYRSLFAPRAGKMFGILVVKSGAGTGYLKGFSGMLDGCWVQQGFVPPVFDIESVGALLGEGENRIIAHTSRLAESGLSAKRVLAQVQLAQLEQEAELALSRLQFSLSRRKRHRKLHRQWLNAHLDVSTPDMISPDMINPGMKNSGMTNSGMANLARQSQQDKKARKAVRGYYQSRLEAERLSLASIETQYRAIEQERAALSRQIQSAVFAHYQLCSPGGKLQSMSTMFTDGLPPGGAGDCAAPKLLHYANQRGYRSLGLAEFWVGAPPESGIRRHGYYYQPCRAKCGPLMSWLTGTTVSTPNSEPALNTSVVLPTDKKQSAIDIVYEDDSMAVVVKPAGLLSTPGKTMSESVYTQLAQRFAFATGPLLVHRLDMDTSGLLLVAKNPRAHKALQRQFINRTIEKRYLALLDGVVGNDAGEISLPLRVDLDDRPRQLVCYKHGKPATTRFTVLKRDAGVTRVVFEPITGRTHQIRVHAAHVKGLHLPIVGDPLYGRAAARMMLHAESIVFRHPDTGQRMIMQSPVPF